MRIYTVVFLIILSSQSIRSQTIFEGKIFFVSNFTAKDSTEAERKDHAIRYRNMEGDSIQMLYSKNGHIKYVYPNSGATGMESYLISPDGTRKMKMRSGEVSNPKDRMKFLGKFQVENQKVLGLDCECYQYRFKTEKFKSLIETYCFNRKLPKVNYANLNLGNNPFETDFYATTETPFLKHTIESDTYVLEYIAYKISLAKIGIEFFQ